MIPLAPHVDSLARELAPAVLDRIVGALPPAQLRARIQAARRPDPLAKSPGNVMTCISPGARMPRPGIM